MLPWIITLLALLVAGITVARSRAKKPSGPSEREALLASLLDASPIAAVLCTDTGLIVFENAAARTLF
ncbi:MAG TPA: hypothetical protein VFX59_29480, partial [Polyangiales bacterium]|nr:hypothetical protein [Polyangiales bacterium]